MGRSNGEITIQNALDTMLASNSQKNRTDGIAQLKSILLNNPKDALTDRAYHGIFEALFKVAQSEKQSYLSGKTAAQMTKAENLLTACSDALRIAIRAGAEKLKAKTVKAVIEHVTQLLPVANGEYCAGLSQFYLKVLGSILEHEAHVEHLEQDDWLSITDFCLQGISQYGIENTSDVLRSSRNLSSISRATSSVAQASSAQLSLRSLKDGSSSSSITKRNSEELLQCLLFLISASNAPVHDRAEQIFRGIMHFLGSHGAFVSSMHQVAFSALNIMLSATNADRTSLPRSLAGRLILIVSQLWSSKSLAKDEMLNSAKDEMLITILLLRLHLEQMIDNADTPDLDQKIEDLERVLRMEYAKRLSRDQLQLDDVSMSTLGGSSAALPPMHIGLLPVRPHAPRAERNWAILAALATLDGLLHIKFRQLNPNDECGEDDIELLRHPRKRRKVVKRFDALIERLLSPNTSERLVAFQTLLYLLPGSRISPQDLSDLLEHLAPFTIDRHGSVSSWAMLCISSCTNHEVARRDACPFDWTQLWHTAARLITNSLTCRAACYMLHSILANGLVSYQEIAEDVDAIVTTTDINAPTTLIDSSVSLMIHLLNMRNMEVPGSSSSASQNVIRWVSSKWDPAEKSFAASCAVDVHPIDILNILRAGLGLPVLLLKSNGNTPRGIIGQALVQELTKEDTIRYLLLLESSSTKITGCPNCANGSGLHESDRLTDSSAHRYATRRLVLELFLPKFQQLFEDWGPQGKEESGLVSTDRLRCAASTCVFACLLQSLIADSGLRQFQEQLDGILDGLATLVLAQLNDIEENRSLVDSMLQAVQPYLPGINSVNLSHISQRNPRLFRLFKSMADHLSNLRGPFSAMAVLAGIDDPMDLDSFDTQRSRSKGTEYKNSLPRRDLSLLFSPASFYSSTLGHMVLISNISRSTKFITSIPSGFVDYVVGLQPNETLLCRPMIREVLRSDLLIEVIDAPKLVEHIGEVMASPKYDCCEVALGLCLDILLGLVPAWASPSDGDLLESAIQLYDWLIGIVLPKRRPSPNVQKGLADLLNELIRRQPSFGETRRMPSVRSCLFDILQKGPICVKFHIATTLPSLFSIFVLKRHDDILVDVLESLPSDPDWEEGIAFRLRVLGALASRWPTLIRLCTYYILEVPGRLPYSIKYATRCLGDVSKALGLENSRALFQLFASQLLYTWLASEPIEGIPFAIFGYYSLKELVDGNREEITALMTMRDQDDAATRLADLLEIPVEELLKQCFGKVMAYSVAYDISVPRSSNSKKYVSGEARIRKRLGKEVFFDLVSKHFPDICALFFSLVDQEEHIVEKSFARDPKLVYAAETMNYIKSSSSSEVVLPPNQQPAFKAKYLTSELEHLCGRTEFEMANLYSPSMLVFIARKLLGTIHPALGSLHACSVLRKLRILVALSGTTALEGYPLEMLLWSTRPFITDSECANDTIGIVQYLLARSTSYLSASPSFVASISLAILASLRSFLESSPVSTTQQSQYRSSLSKAQSFQSWLGSWIAQYETVVLNDSSKAAFRSMVQSAHAFGSIGNADSGTSESDLLVGLFEDERCGRRLVNKATRNLVFSLLYSNFTQPTSFRKDILGSDDRATAFAPTLWSFCQDAPMGGSFLIWVAKTLGRAFAASGKVHQQMIQESGLKRIMESVNTAGQKSSKSCILQLIQTLTAGENPQTAGLAEAVLRVIITRTKMPPGSAGVVMFEEILSDPLFRAFDWTPYQVPPSDMLIYQSVAPRNPYDGDSISELHWPRMLAISLVHSAPFDNVLHALQRLLQDADGFAEEAFPFIIHLVLSLQLNGLQTAKRQLSKSLRLWLSNEDTLHVNHLKLLINTLLYLRTQPLPNESSSADRMNWLEIDYRRAAEAAVRCGMFKTALLFIEISVSETMRTSRRSSMSKPMEPQEILLSIFKQVDDPDIYYGLQQSASLDTVLERLEYENDGLKTLAFRGAQLDIHLRRQNKSSTSDAHALVNALGMLNLDGLSHSLLQAQQIISMDGDSIKRMFQTARKLEQWDLPTPSVCGSQVVTVYKTFQAVNLAEDRHSINEAISEGLRSIMSNLTHVATRTGTIRSSLQSLAALTEMDEILSSSGSEQFEEMLERFYSRMSWMQTGKFDDVSHIMSCRQTVLSCLSQHSYLRGIVNISTADSRLVEVQTTLLSSGLSRAHGALQESLKSATYLTSLIEPCQALGLSIEAAAHLEAANALWEQGEMASSIGMLQSLEKNSILKKQTIAIGRSNLLAKVGYQVSVARLEKPDRIIEKYLMPAIKELKGKVEGGEAGQVFHEFAIFCDQQLQDADGLEDLTRLKKLKEMKASEVQDLGKMVRAATSSDQKAKYHGHLVKAKQWLQLDTEEYRRLSASKDELLRQSLENYLLSLKASDGHNNDALRFSALWLEHSEEDIAMEAVSKHLENVPTRKFASLMNQLTSRLLDSSIKFQQLLFSLILRICIDHPYHGMYQIWAGCKSKSNSKDETAVSRQAATNKVAHQIANNSKSAKIWIAINKTSTVYCQLAAEKDEHKYKAGQRIQLKDSQAGSILNNLLPRFPIPPPTLQIKILPDLDYSSVPVMHKLEPQISIASGVSTPKIITVIASDGSRLKQLVKGGNDDLRQDAIMEQVFAQVSELLRTNTSTRQRNLGIRTYKVLPLSSNAGIIEFVSNTVPLHEFLMPAHERYYPKDLKGSQCRKQISDVQTQKLEVRVKTYRTVTEQFHPVMRYFFMEKFYDPDEWFAKRLAYTRSTAAISMLGHILGLGDRHGHNILLDEKTGEVVHIDLGVAFEMGRVLPVPELVPFRLTRDIVDGMGITKTDGVYRRCCEFTLEALRKESYSIMTILDVLRYDPLYSWSISPVRLAKLQDAQSAAPALNIRSEAAGPPTKAREVMNEPSEADRALTVVKKKLSKTLSVTATVNDLINQAGDERNLAALYSGWAAYA